VPARRGIEIAIPFLRPAAGHPAQMRAGSSAHGPRIGSIVAGARSKLPGSARRSAEPSVELAFVARGFYGGLAR